MTAGVDSKKETTSTVFAVDRNKETETKKMPEDTVRWAKMGLTMSLMYTTAYMNFENHETCWWCVVGYTVSQIAVFVSQFVMWRNIATTCSNEDTEGFVMLDSSKANKWTTPYRYDMDKLKSMVKQSILGLCIGLAIHYKWDTPRALMMQMFMAPFTVMENNLVTVHLFRSPATGELERPWIEDERAKLMFTPVNEGATSAKAGDKVQVPRARTKTQKTTVNEGDWPD